MQRLEWITGWGDPLNEGIRDVLFRLLNVVPSAPEYALPRAILEEDPEIEDLRHIVIVVRKYPEEIDAYFAANDAYTRDLFAIMN